jgi:3-dehydroquinate dehydratase-2
MNILLINGPNLNLIGRREPGIYGGKSLADINRDLQKHAEQLGISLEFIQSNHEGELVDALQKADAYAGVILNGGAYTHTSIALRDAACALKIPLVEVHFSNPAAREPFRHTSLLATAAAGCVAGFGADSYHLALYWFYHRFLA